MALPCVKRGCEREATVGAYCAPHLPRTDREMRRDIAANDRVVAVLLVASLLVIGLLGPVLALCGAFR